MSTELPARPPTAERSRAARRIPWVVTAAAALTILVGLAATALLPPRSFGSYLGTPLPPFFAFWRPQAGLYLAPAVLLLAASVALAPRLCRRPVGALAFATGSLAIALSLRLALAAVREGPSRWRAIFGRITEAGDEYLPSTPGAVGLDVIPYLDRFAELAPTLTLHASAHPPGLPVALELLGIESAAGMAALTIGIGALAAPLTYLLGRELLDEGRARIAALLFAFSPSALLYGATSADALFATVGLLAGVLLLARRPLLRALGPPAVVMSALFSFSLAGVAAWATLVTAARDGLWPAFRLAAWCGIALVAGFVGLWAATGFDVLGTLESADDAYRKLTIFRVRSYAYWLFGSPTAFLIAAGLPIAWYALRALASAEAAASALAGLVAAAALLGYTKAETERIWLFMVPFACVAAASALPRRWLAPVLALLGAQALAVEVLLYTIW
jgi:hypothetical protein